MKAEGKTVTEILLNVPEDRIESFNKLHEVIVKNLPKGFEPGISYGGLGYVIPHKLYPAGYHCKPEEPLPFAGIASQKGSINFYHMGIYADPDLMKWFVAEYPKHSKQKLDMGKSCVRFKKVDDLALDVIGRVLRETPAKLFIARYESSRVGTRGSKKKASKKASTTR